MLAHKQFLTAVSICDNRGSHTGKRVIFCDFHLDGKCFPGIRDGKLQIVVPVSNHFILGSPLLAKTVNGSAVDGDIQGRMAGKKNQLCMGKSGVWKGAGKSDIVSLIGFREKSVR